MIVNIDKFMLFVNKIKEMFYINSHKKVETIKEKQVLNSVLIPPEERVTKDHQTLYRFFINNEMLKELQRTKSLNARIKCIAGLLLIANQAYTSQQHILMHIFEDQRLIILPIPIKLEAQAFNQKLIRRKMDLLTTFSMMQTLTYNQLLYLAYNMEEEQCKYKDYVYKQGDAAEHFYLMLEGQFHYVKDCNQNQSKLALNKKKNKLIKLKSLQGEEQNPNKCVKPHIIRYKVGIVEGKLGQAVGLEQIVLDQYKQKGRKYSVLCNSTQNKYIKIHKKYLQALFEQIPSFHEKIYSQIQDANSAKAQLFQQIKATKLNISKYLKKSQQKLQNHQEEEQQMRTLQNTASARNNLPLISKKSSFSNDYQSKDRSRVFSSALSGPTLKSEQNHIKSLKSESNLQVEHHPQRYHQENQASFDLTSIRETSNRRSLKSPKDQQGNKQITANRQSFQSKDFDPNIYLPLIGKRSVANLGESNSNADGFNSKQRSRMHQYGGMVDSSKLIKEKESILERKSNKLMREDIFPLGHIQYKQLNKTNREDPMKLKASPAHSNRFMQKMLLKVLKKAGYDEANKNKLEQAGPNKTVNIKAHRQFHGSLSRNKKKQQAKSVNKQDLLVNSAFDDCYFAKI